MTIRKSVRNIAENLDKMVFDTRVGLYDFAYTFFYASNFNQLTVKANDDGSLNYIIVKSLRALEELNFDPAKELRRDYFSDEELKLLDDALKALIKENDLFIPLFNFERND